jgi:hypothetical protein
MRLSPLGTTVTILPSVPGQDDRWWWLRSSRWEDWQGKLKYSEKICPRSTVSTTNPIWLDPDSNPGRSSGKTATNRLSYGTVIIPLRNVIMSTRRGVRANVYRKGKILELPKHAPYWMLYRRTRWLLIHYGVDGTEVYAIIMLSMSESFGYFIQYLWNVVYHGNWEYLNDVLHKS